jgi:tRNA dimethylallyltransferase
MTPGDLVGVVRALAVAALSGRPLSAWQEEHAFRDGGLEALVLGCARPREELHARIAARCDAMLAGGLVEEIRGLWARGFGPALPALGSVGYREIGAHLAGACGWDDAVAAFHRATRRLAKRQRTWFAADPSIHWHHPDHDRAALRETARTWLARRCPPPISTSSVHSPR